MSVPPAPRRRPRAPRSPRPWLARLTAFARRRTIPLAAAGIGLAGAGAVALGMHAEQLAPPTVPYSTLVAARAAGTVRELSVEGDGSRLTAVLAKPIDVAGRRADTVIAMVPAQALSVQDLERWSSSNVAVRVESLGMNRAAIGQALVAILMVGAVLYLVFLQRRGGATSTSRFAVTPPSRTLTMADVGGAREAQADLQDIIAYLREPSRFDKLGAKCPTGVLLVGPPGTGKTLLARAIAGEAGCPVITAAGSDFNEMFVGVGASRVRALAKQAREQAPCVVFIDEFDSVGGKRGRPNRTGEEEVTLNQLLAEMDGVGGSAGVVWMAATNREDMLDPAVKRPGRFDRIVEVGLPTAVDREAILRIHSANRPVADDVDMAQLARLTVGYSGAELANLINEAAIIAVRTDSETITADHIEEARDKILLGRVRTGVVVSDDERRLIALHEAGHAVVGLVACPEDKLHKVTIEPRGRSLGAAHFAPDADRHLHSRRYLEGVIAKALGGRAAELVFLGPDAVTSGAGGDLVQATGVARRMVAEFGMSTEVGLVSADPGAQGGAPSAALQAQIDTAVRSLTDRLATRANEIVLRHRDAVERIADALVEREVLLAADLRDIALACGLPVAGLAVEEPLAQPALPLRPAPVATGERAAAYASA
ncbi:MAG: ATP-dependent metallopeptidase FtsH/Yme1/Tma family protein [Gemmatimonadaceae bacterium]